MSTLPENVFDGVAEDETVPTPRPRATRKSGQSPDPYGLLYGESGAMRVLYDQIAKVAASQATVLVVGESGTGKELVAKTIHMKSARCDKPFIPVNCGAIPHTLIEAELFGHEKGSFTGAVQQQAGYFEHAEGGTLFLDEITEMPPEMQTKLLRVLESGTFHRVGGTQELRANVRIVAATNRDPQDAVEKGIFREDLFYRLAVFPIRVPLLRERGADIELLARHFLAGFNANKKTSKTLSQRSLEVLANYSWPGNVRELKNILYRAFIMADDMLDIPYPGAQRNTARTSWEDGRLNVQIGMTLAEAQREIILAMLEHFGGDKRETARALGISLKTLYNRLESYQGARADSSSQA